MPASSVKPFWMVATALAILALALYIGLFEIAQTSDTRRRMTEQIIVASALRHAR